MGGGGAGRQDDILRTVIVPAQEVFPADTRPPQPHQTVDQGPVDLQPDSWQAAAGLGEVVGDAHTGTGPLSRSRVRVRPAAVPHSTMYESAGTWL